MIKDSVPFLCGGTFYILLLQALKKDRRIRVNDLDGHKAKEKSINDVTCLKGLVRTFYDFNEYLSDSTFNAHKNQYKMCEKNSTEWLRFETQYLIDAYDEKVRSDYASALADMDGFIDTFIDDGDLGKKLVRALLEVIDKDQTIEDETEFIIWEDGKTIDKKNLLALPRIEARIFILSVWHFIVTSRGTLNTNGTRTVGEWLHHDTSQAPYKYIGTVGNNYATDKDISYEKIIVERAEEAEVSDNTDFMDTEDKNEDNADQGKSAGQATNQVLNAQTVFNQRAEKIVNIEHVDHLEI